MFAVINKGTRYRRRGDMNWTRELYVNRLFDPTTVCYLELFKGNEVLERIREICPVGNREYGEDKSRAGRHRTLNSSNNN